MRVCLEGLQWQAWEILCLATSVFFCLAIAALRTNDEAHGFLERYEILV